MSVVASVGDKQSLSIGNVRRSILCQIVGTNCCCGYIFECAVYTLHICVRIVQCVCQHKAFQLCDERLCLYQWVDYVVLIVHTCMWDFLIFIQFDSAYSHTYSGSIHTIVEVILVRGKEQRRFRSWLLPFLFRVWQLNLQLSLCLPVVLSLCRDF